MDERLKVVATSDFHGHLPDIPECDLLLIAGDITPVWDHNTKFQMDWLRHKFTPWLNEQPVKEAVWIAGNHDIVLSEARRFKIDELGGTYLHNEAAEVLNTKIWGSPYAPTFGGWPFMKDDEFLWDYWEKIPYDTEILLVHGPPFGFVDKTAGYMGSRQDHVGSRTLRNRINKLQRLKLVVCGHIHPAYGQTKTFTGVTVINATHVNERYEPVNPPVEVEI